MGIHSHRYTPVEFLPRNVEAVRVTKRDNFIIMVVVLEWVVEQGLMVRCSQMFGNIAYTNFI